jgi:hypothetical protein
LAAHPGDQTLDMLNRRFGQDAVAEIENMRAALKAAQHPLDLFVEAASARNQRQRIKIALERYPLGQSGDGGSGISGGVEANRVDTSEASEFGKLRPGAARKGDQPRTRRFVANFGCDRRDWRDAPAFKFGRRQHARPGIEDLRRIRAGRELAAKVFG